MKRVLILQNFIPSYRKPVYNGLAEDYDVTVLHSGLPAVEAVDSFREVVVDAHAIGPFVVQRNVLERLARHRYDVVIAMLDVRWLAHVMPALVRRDRNARWIFWSPGRGRNRLANCVRNLLLRRANALILYGTANVDKLVRSGTPHDKIFVAHNTIHIPNHKDCSGAQKSSLLFVGRIQKRKRVDLLIETFSKVVRDLPRNTILEIVGATSRRGFGNFKMGLCALSDLRRMAVDAGLADRVIFHGAVESADQLARIFARAYAYVSPGHVGLGVLHSFAYGVPVITHGRASDHAPEFENLQDGVNSLLCDADTELAGTLSTICNQRGLSAQLGANAYRHYATARTLDTMLGGFRRAIEGC